MKVRSTSISLLLLTAGFSLNLSAIEIVDLDNDGQISLAEIEAAKEAARAELLSQFDLDNDGELSDEERAAARDARRAEVVAEFDTDNDGELTREERQAARAARRAAFEANFDTDQDGQLSDVEQANLEEVAQVTRESRGGRSGNRRANR